MWLRVDQCIQSLSDWCVRCIKLVCIGCRKNWLSNTDSKTVARSSLEVFLDVLSELLDIFHPTLSHQIERIISLGRPRSRAQNPSISADGNRCQCLPTSADCSADSRLFILLADLVWGPLFNLHQPAYPSCTIKLLCNLPPPKTPPLFMMHLTSSTSWLLLLIPVLPCCCSAQAVLCMHTEGRNVPE